MCENHITREIDFWGDVLCVWERYTLHSACAWGREMSGDLESGGRDVCMPERQSDSDLCWGPDFTRDRGVNVLVYWCLGERMTSLCVCVCGGGVDLR